MSGYARPSRLRQFRWSLLLGGAAAVLIGCSFLAARCEVPTRTAGSGLLEFNGYAESGVWRDDQALGINRLFTWAELEPAEGVYNWDEFDALILIARANGKRIAPRVYTNIGPYGQATPDWVFDDGAASYLQDPSEPRQPVPTDSVFTAHFAAFLAAMGQRFDGNKSIEFIQTNAGMGGYGEMVWGYPQDRLPPGWTPAVQIATTEFWIDRWRNAFPHTHLVLMENFLGYNIGERVADYAAQAGFYLQANDSSQSPESLEILRSHSASTRIILEVEDSGCGSAAGLEWDAMTDKIFGYGFPIDYLVICGESFGDTARIHATIERLRSDPALD